MFIETIKLKLQKYLLNADVPDQVFCQPVCAIRAHTAAFLDLKVHFVLFKL